MSLVYKMMTVGLGMMAGFATTALGVDRNDQPIPERRQTRLLERFGDQGIDANSDGVLTRAEVRTFRAENGLQGRRGGPRDGRGGKPGFGGHMFGPGGRLGHMLRAMERLQAETAPEWFTIERFSDADLDQDGTLSPDEWLSFADGERARIIEQLLNMSPTADADKDGQLSDTELQALKDAHMDRVRVRILEHHPEADTDGDGMLSDAEFEAVRATRLAVILERHPEADLDGDGVLSEDEMDPFAMEHHGRRGGPRGFGGWGHGPHGKFQCSPAKILERHPEADTDGDGTLSDEELQTFIESRPRGARGGDYPKGRAHSRGWRGARP